MKILSSNRQREKSFVISKPAKFNQLQVRWLDKEAKRHGVGVSCIIRSIVAEKMEAQTNGTK